MFGTKANRKSRRNAADRGRTSTYTSTYTKVMVTATAAAAAMSVGLTNASPAMAVDEPTATNIDITQDPTFTAGLLAGLLDQLGLDVLTVPLNISFDVPLVGTITIGDLNLVLDNVASNPPSIYNANNGYNGWITGGNTRYRFPANVGIGNGAYDLVNAYRAQLASVQGTTEPGYTPFVPGPDGKVNFTSQGLILVNNPYRPDGGILSRFAGPLNLLGIDTSMPAAGKVSSNSGKITLNTATLDVAWAYSPLADFPVTMNPFSIVNSLFAAVPVNLLGGVDLAGLDITNAGLNIASTLGILYKMTGGLVGVGDGQAWYGTLVPNQLPILEPLRLPAQIINLIAGSKIVGTPLADALEPALKILVNIGYSDVVTPSEGGTYDRTFTTSATPESFLSVNPLTPQEWAQVPGDVFRALIAGFQDAFPILRFGQPAPVLTVSDDHLAISYSTSPPPSSAASFHDSVETAAPAPALSSDTSTAGASPEVSQVQTATDRTANSGSVPSAELSPTPGTVRTSSVGKAPNKVKNPPKQGNSVRDSTDSSQGGTGHTAGPRAARAAS